MQISRYLRPELIKLEMESLLMTPIPKWEKSLRRNGFKSEKRPYSRNA